MYKIYLISKSSSSMGRRLFDLEYIGRNNLKRSCISRNLSSMKKNKKKCKKRRKSLKIEKESREEKIEKMKKLLTKKLKVNFYQI